MIWTMADVTIDLSLCLKYLVLQTKTRFIVDLQFFFMYVDAPVDLQLIFVCVDAVVDVKFSVCVC